MTELTALDIGNILKMLPHRYPFLLVDRVIDLVPNERATGIKNVTMNEPHFQGHFPENPVMPGVLIIEAMAQTAGLTVIAGLGPDAGAKLVYFMTIDEARFRKPVVPGDVLHIHVEKTQNRKTVWKFRCEAKVDGQLVAEAVVSAMISDS